MTDFICYPTGHGGHLGGGLGEALRGLGTDICGRQTVGEFLALTLTEQMGFTSLRAARRPSQIALFPVCPTQLPSRLIAKVARHWP